MSQPTKRPRGDGDAADEPTEGGAVVASASAALATSSQQAMHLVNGVAVTMSFVYTTMYHPAAVLYLLANGQVSFQQAGDLPACCSHGNWTMSGDQLTLRVWFHFNANWAQIREHVYLRLPHTSSFELQGTHAEYRAFLIPRSAQ
jgi:hypothetical protein